MDPKVLKIEVPYTPDNLLRGLEQKLLNSNGRRQAIHDLVKWFHELDATQQMRFMGYIMQHGNENQKTKLAARVTELHGTSVESFDIAYGPWKHK